MQLIPTIFSNLGISTVAYKIASKMVRFGSNILLSNCCRASMAKIGDETFNRLRKIEQDIIDSSTAITVVSDFMKSYVVKKYSTANKPVIVVPPAGPILSDRQENIKNYNVVYAGSVHTREHVDLFAYSIPFVKQPTSFLIISYQSTICRNITAYDSSPTRHSFKQCS